jgi:hypothetical protein
MPPKRKEAAVKISTTEVGESGLKQWSGIVREEFLPNLQGLRGLKTYREMKDNDPVVGAALFAAGMLLRNAPWNVQAADDSDEGEDMKLYVEEVMKDFSVPWTQVMTEILTMLPYGFAPMEIILKQRKGYDADPMKSSAYDDGMYGVANLALRAQESLLNWEYDAENGDKLTGMKQQLKTGGSVVIPIEKLCIFRTEAVSGNPEGRSILRNAYRPWYFKKRIEVDAVEPIGSTPEQLGDYIKVELVKWAKIVKDSGARVD